jgi:hypothetical protein
MFSKSSSLLVLLSISYSVGVNAGIPNRCKSDTNTHIKVGWGNSGLKSEELPKKEAPEAKLLQREQNKLIKPLKAQRDDLTKEKGWLLKRSAGFHSKKRRALVGVEVDHINKQLKQIQLDIAAILCAKEAPAETESLLVAPALTL